MPGIHQVPISLLAALLGCALATVAQADQADSETVVVRIHRAAPTAAARQALERRIAAAALEVCGASPFSAPGVKEAVARTACWRDSYAAGIARIDGTTRTDLAAIPPAHAKGKP